MCLQIQVCELLYRQGFFKGIHSCVRADFFVLFQVRDVNHSCTRDGWTISFCLQKHLRLVAQDKLKNTKASEALKLVVATSMVKDMLVVDKRKQCKKRCDS